MIQLRELKPLYEDGELLIELDKEHSQVKAFYECFEKDFIKYPFQVDGRQIRLVLEKSKIKLYENYSETFVHIITREHGPHRHRFYECHRANRIHWIKPILLSHPTKEILYYKWKDEKGVCKEHFWFRTGDFMVVLKEIAPEMQIVTAFCVDKGEQLRYFERYKNFTEVNSNGCK